MSFKETRTPLSSITLDPTASIVRQYSDMLNGTQSRYVDLVLDADFTIATAVASAILNRGSLLAAIDRLGIEMDGKDQFNIDARVARFWTEVSSPSAVFADRLTSTAIGTTHLREIVRLYFAHPFSVSPMDTAFREDDPARKLRVFGILKASAAAQIATAGGGGTVTLGTITITVAQVHDRFKTSPPLLRPYMRQWTDTISGANSDFRSNISFSRYMRALIIQQDAPGAGEVNDIISAVALRGDTRDIIGPKMQDWRSLALAQTCEYGGSVYADTAESYVALVFSSMGRLNGCLNPAQDTNLRFELSVAPTAAAGATSSIIRYTSIELERVPGITADKLPFAI